MGLFSYLVCYYRTAGSSGICCDLQSTCQLPWAGADAQRLISLKPYHNTLVVNASDDCCTSTGSLGHGNAPGVQSRVAVVVGEVEARHRGDAGVIDGSVGKGLGGS